MAVRGTMSACHCGMCRKWAGGPFLAVDCESIAFDDESSLVVRKTSDWAERAHCGECGSCIFYRLTVEGPHQGATSVAYGTLDDTSGLAFEREWFIDEKPGGYAFAGEREKLDAEAIAKLFG